MRESSPKPIPMQIATMIRHLLDQYTRPVPAIIEVGVRGACKHKRALAGCSAAALPVPTLPIHCVTMHRWYPPLTPTHAPLSCMQIPTKDQPYDPSQDSILARVKYMFGEG